MSDLTGVEAIGVQTLELEVVDHEVIDDAVERVNTLDWSRLEHQLAGNRELGFSVTETDVPKLVDMYKQYLALNIAYPGESLVPTDAVDAVWHTHLLDSRKYAEDCGELFGEILHHNPEFGKDPFDQSFIAASETTKELAAVHFDELSYFEVSEEFGPQNAGCSSCGS